MTKPLLSIGMIVKNEIRCLERCLKSLEPLRKAIPCQLVIADTGSTDGSREVAEKYADILFDFTWVNDFAAARNAVLEKCTGQWYLTIDADEWLENIDELVTFLTGEEGKVYNKAMPFQRNYTESNFLEYSDSCVPRMGKLRGGKLRYQYPIHEDLYFTDSVPNKTKLLNNTFLHHDGYLEREDGSKESKARRNMALLRVEQEKDPQNLRTLCQCIQSAVDNEERRKYIALGLAAAEKADRKDPFLPTLYHTCLQLYTIIPEYEAAEACLQKARKMCPSSYLLRVDGEAFAAVSAYYLKDWETAADHLNHWEAALEELARNKNADLSERMFSGYSTRSPYAQCKMRTLAAECLSHLERSEDVIRLLPKIQLDLLSCQNALALLTAVLNSAAALPDEAAGWLQSFWDFALEQAQSEDVQRQKDGRALLAYAEGIFRRQFPVGEEPGPAAAVLARMGACTPGRCARVLLSRDPEAIAALWAEENDWARVFPEALLHCLELDLPFPGGLLRQPCEAMAGQTAQMVSVLGLRMVRALVRWMEEQPEPETMAQLLWRLDLVTASFQAEGWWEDEGLGRRLCGAYRALSRAMIAQLYRPEVLNEADIAVLPGMHRFAWYCERAGQALEAGDELGYVRALRAGLKAAPAMKRAVEFMLKHRPAPQPAPELLALARQVKEILARYAPDDPAVLALKQSPAYQKVAHLLEGDSV